MTCLYRMQGATTTNGSDAPPGTAGFGDIGCAPTGGIGTSALSTARFEYYSSSNVFISNSVASNGHPFRSIRGYDSVAGVDQFHWAIKADTYPSPAGSTVTGPWSMRIYCKLPTPGSTLTFLTVRESTTVNAAWGRLISADRIARTGTGNAATITGGTGLWWRLEIQADPSRTSNLVWRVYQEDATTPTAGFQDSATSVTWDEIRLGYLTSGWFNGVYCEFADIEIHDDYDLGGKFRSSPQDGTTPASATATGAPSTPMIVPSRFNYDATSNKTLARSTPSYTSYTDVSYTTTPSNYNRKFDMYVPDGTPPSGGWPLICWAHSGFFSKGAKTNLPSEWRDDLLANGYAVASIQYVKTSEDLVAPYDSYGTSNLGGRYPSFIVDYKRAAAYIRDNYATYGINPDKMFATGYSAGGYIALAAAMSRDLDDDGYGNKLSIVAAQAASLPWAGGYIFDDPAFIGCMVFAAPVDMDLANAWDPTYPSSSGIIKYLSYRWFQGLIANGSSVAPDMPAQSIVGHIALNSPSNLCPVAYVRGTADYLVHWEHQEALATALDGLVDYTEMITPNNHDHANDIYDISEQLAWLNNLAYPETVSQEHSMPFYYDGAASDNGHLVFGNDGVTAIPMYPEHITSV